MLRWALLLAALFLPLAGAASQEVVDEAAMRRGGYVFVAAGCYACHTDVKGKGAPLAGGRRLKTPFGDFIGPNITPHAKHGIGGWTPADFTRALREEVSPAGDPPAGVGEKDREAQERGVYLVRVLGHCGECHTPRGGLGAMDQDLFLAGSGQGAEGALVPNIMPRRATGIGNWSLPEIEDNLGIGMDPDGDFAGGPWPG